MSAARVAVLGGAMAIVSIAASDGAMADAGFGLAIASGVLSALGPAGHEIVVGHGIYEPSMPSSGPPALP